MAQLLQASRFELKYIVDEPTAHSIRDYVLGYLEPDDFSRGTEIGYPVWSLYLDTPDLALYGQTLQGKKNRFKLRIRFYDDNPNTPAFLEIKRRVTDVICKERAGLNREGIQIFLQGARPGESNLYKPNNKAIGALQEFCRLRDAINADGVLYVSYLREAYVSPNSNQLRVTFDRELMGSVYRRGSILKTQPEGVHPEMGGVILELKFTDRFPTWMRDLVENFNLQRRSVPKYVDCLEKMGLKPSRWVNALHGIPQ